MGGDRWLEGMTRDVFSLEFHGRRDPIWKERASLGDSEIPGRGGAGGAAYGLGVKCITELGRRPRFLALQGIRPCFSKLKTSSFTSISRQLIWHRTKVFSQLPRSAVVSLPSPSRTWAAGW